MNKIKIKAIETVLDSITSYIKDEHGFEFRESKRHDLLVIESNTKHPAEPYIYIWLDYKRLDRNGNLYNNLNDLERMPFHIEVGHFKPTKQLVGTGYCHPHNIWEMFTVIDEYCNRMKEEK
tara:strand:+ start:154 stop:516 length:363 start_codon:yes stop_codon:yes gene_type:complete